MNGNEAQSIGERRFNMVVRVEERSGGGGGRASRGSGTCDFNLRGKTTKFHQNRLIKSILSVHFV